MNDILPEETPLWRYAEKIIQQVLTTYGYREIRLPLLEPTLLFDRSIGEVTDIVEKEMYTFPDRNGESLTLRPEGTAGCVRACQEHGLLFNQTQRLWYQGPMFRYERPQKGRYRQFHQIGVEAFGFAAPELDAELLLLSAELWRQLGLTELVTLEINSIGSAEARGRYRADLVAYLSTRKEKLDDDSRRRLDSNPLRILDSKVPETQALLDQAPVITDYLDQPSRDHFARWADRTIPNLTPEEHAIIEDWAAHCFQTLLFNLVSPSQQRDLYEEFGLDPDKVIAEMAAMVTDETRRENMKEQTNIFRVLVKTLLNAGIITDRTRGFYAIYVDMEELKTEGDRMVGDDIAEEGIKYLQEINFKDRALKAVKIAAE